MLVHVSYLVELSGWCHVHNLFDRFTDSRVQLYDVLAIWLSTNTEIGSITYLGHDHDFLAR